MTAWQRLGLSGPTANKEAIQLAYEQCLSDTETQASPAKLQQLQADFEWACAWANDWQLRQEALTNHDAPAEQQATVDTAANVEQQLDLGQIARQVYALALDAPDTALVELDHRLEREIPAPAARAELGERLQAAIASETGSAGVPLSFIRGVLKRFPYDNTDRKSAENALLQQIQQRMEIAACQEVLAREQEHQSDLNPVGAAAIGLIRSAPEQTAIDAFVSSGPKRVALLNQYRRLQEAFPSESSAVFSPALNAWVASQTEPSGKHKKTNRSPKTVGSEHPWFAFSAIISVVLLMAIAIVFATSSSTGSNLAPAPSINWGNISARASFSQHPQAARCEQQLKGTPRYLSVESCNRYIELLAQSTASKAGAASEVSAQSYRKSSWLKEADNYNDYVHCIYKQPNRPFYLRDQSCFKKHANPKKYARISQQLADCFVDFPGLIGQHPATVADATGLPQEQRRCGRLQLTLHGLSKSAPPVGGLNSSP